MSAANARENPLHTEDDQDHHKIRDVEHQRVLPESIVDLGHDQGLMVEADGKESLGGHMETDGDRGNNEDAETRLRHQTADQSDEHAGDGIADIRESMTEDFPELVPEMIN